MVILAIALSMLCWLHGSIYHWHVQIFVLIGLNACNNLFIFVVVVATF